MNRRLLLLVSLITVFSVLLAACGGAQPAPATAPTAAPAATEAPAAAAPAATEAPAAAPPLRASGKP